MKRLYKSQNDKVFAGVIGGLGEYYEIDPVLLRLAFLLVVIITGVFPGIVAYIIASIIVPKKPPFKEANYTEKKTEETKTEENK
jgi:phage shock protein C